MNQTRTVPHRAASGAGAPSESRPALRVIVVSGPDAGHATVIARPSVLVGRGETADVRLTDPTVSQFHAELTATAEGVRVVDAGSRNGTRAGGVRIERGVIAVGTALELGSTVLRVEFADDFALPRSQASAFGGLAGESGVMRELYALLERLARTDLSVVITGETGTGKEVAARALHGAGPRRDKPFVVLDCTAIPPTLAASVLFGHEKGAFTGATDRKAGVFEAAHGGTVFIDEVGELPAELQPMLLRVLQQREVVPVGANKARPVDVRIVSATWRDLPAMVNAGTFREDLYYRLAQATVRMPSLAERREDIGLLVHQFLSRPAVDGQRTARAIARDALEAVAARHYPGNVRELQSTVQRLAMLAEGPMITAADLAFERMLCAARDRPVTAESAPASGTPGSDPRGASSGSLPASQPPVTPAARPSVTPPPAAATTTVPPPADPQAEIGPFKDAKRTLVDEFERAYLARLLARTKNNLSHAAALAGLERHNLRDLLKKHGLYTSRE